MWPPYRGCALFEVCRQRGDRGLSYKVARVLSDGVGKFKGYVATYMYMYELGRDKSTISLCCKAGLLASSDCYNKH